MVAVVGSKPVAATAAKPAARVGAKGAIKTKTKAEPQLKLVSAKAAARKPRKAPAAKRPAVRVVR